MSHNIQTLAATCVNRRYALGWAALLCMYCVAYSAPALSQETHAATNLADSAVTRTPSDSALHRSPENTHTAVEGASREMHSEAATSRSTDKLTRDAQSDAAQSGSAGSASVDVANSTNFDGSSAATASADSTRPTRAAHGDALAHPTVERGADAHAAASDREQESARPAAASSEGGPGVVNINSAGAVELELLPRIGPARAQAILALRTKLRQFSRVEQLLQVKGIGRATFRRLRPLLALNGPTTLERKRGR